MHLGCDVAVNIHFARSVSVVAALMTTLLAACSSNYGTSDSGTDTSQLFDFVKGAWSGDGNHISLQDASAVPFASIGVRMGSGPEQMLILASRNGDTFTWTSRSHIVLSIRNCQIASNCDPLFASNNDPL